MPQEFIVYLGVSMQVWADQPMEALEVGRGWLSDTLRATAQGEVRNARVIPRSEKQEEKVYTSTTEEERSKQEVRRTPGRAELLEQLHSAVTAEDYLAAQVSLRQWLTDHPELYSTALSSLAYRLDTFKAAILWSEQHPDGPRVWNIGALLTAIKAEVQKEVDATKALSESA